jgi:hypothetical protein
LQTETWTAQIYFLKLELEVLHKIQELPTTAVYLLVLAYNNI